MPETVQDLIRASAQKYGIPAEFALAVADQESGLNPTLTGPVIAAGPSKGQRAVGTFQIVPSTADLLGINASDPRQNIDGGVKYLRQLFDQHQGDLEAILRDYGGVVHNEDYVPGVLGRIPKFKTTEPPPPRIATSPPAAATAGMVAPSTIEGDPEAAQRETQRDAEARLTKEVATRFGSEALQAGVVEPVKGIAGIVMGLSTNPVETLKALASAVTEPTLRHLTAATEARGRGDLKTWTKEMAFAIPLLGPMAQQIGEEFESGDVPGAMGRVAGTAFTFAGPKALGGVRATKAEGKIPLLRGERTGSGVSQFIERITEHTIPGSGVFRRFRERQQTALANEAEQLASQLSAIPAGSGETGTLVRRAIDTAMDEKKARAGELYSEIDALTQTTRRRVPVIKQVPVTTGKGSVIRGMMMPKRSMQIVETGGVMVPTRVLKQVALPMLRRLRQEERLIPAGELARTSGLLTRIVGAPKQVNFRAFQDARSDLLRIVRSQGDPIPGKAGGAAKLLAGTADEVMHAAAEQSGIPGLAKLVDEANTLWGETKTVYNAPFLKRVVKASPEAIPGLIRSADVDELSLLKRAVPADVFDTARARVMRDLIGEAAEAPPVPATTSISERLGLTAEGVPVAPRPYFSGKKLETALQKLGTEKATLLFGKTGVQGLEEIGTLAERIRPVVANRIAGGLIAAGVNATILAPFTAPILRPFGVSAGALAAGAAGAATAAVSLNVLARLITRPEGLTAYRLFLRGLGTGNRPLALAAGLRLTAQMAHAADAEGPP